MCSSDVTDLHIPWLCQQPFIFYSSCHLWRRQLLWLWRLSNLTVCPDMWYTMWTLTATDVHKERIKPCRFHSSEFTPRLLLFLWSKRLIIQRIIQLCCYPHMLEEKTANAVFVHTLVFAGSRMCNSNICQQLGSSLTDRCTCKNKLERCSSSREPCLCLILPTWLCELSII